MVFEAKRINSERIESGRIKLFEASIQNTPFDDDYFGGVCAINTLYFWSNVKDSLKEVHRILEKGACFYLTQFPKSEIKDLPASKYFPNLISIKEIEKLLSDVGFRKIEKTIIKEPPINIGEESKIFKAALFVATK